MARKIIKNLGGDRLGSGAKMNVAMHGFGRSTHDLGSVWRSTMSCGTLVPFMKKIALPGDSWDIDLDTRVKTLPTTGPLFGSFKLQLDVFQIPIRLYNAFLHNNKKGIGMTPENVLFPTAKLKANGIDFNSNTPLEWQQFDQSSLWAYLGVRGLGRQDAVSTFCTREVNALYPIAYYDIVANYYINKQEDNAYIIAADPDSANKIGVPEYMEVWNESVMSLFWTTDQLVDTSLPKSTGPWTSIVFKKGNGIQISYRDIQLFDVDGSGEWHELTDLGACTETDTSIVLYPHGSGTGISFTGCRNTKYYQTGGVSLVPFDITELDIAREKILQSPSGTILMNDLADVTPYYYITGNDSDGHSFNKYSQNGLAVKTYQSDLLNNWLKTEWIDGPNGISQITAIDTSSGSFKVDALNFANKLYDTLNRVLVSGGSYEDYIEAVYGYTMPRRCETPMYMGGLSTEVVFDDVVSTAKTDDPLGTLGGRGTISGKRKGGKISIKVSEPAILMGIVSLTPRVDYSQGNDWSTNLTNLGQLHIPTMDGIGFQELITDQMSFLDTEVSQDYQISTKSAGKQPAWINYMTAINECFGNFAHPEREMFMTLNRRYDIDKTGITDLTTYIDPVKYNYAFADGRLDAQNFWVQIAVDAEVRRTMSAKVIPNL